MAPRQGRRAASDPRSPVRARGRARSWRSFMTARPPTSPPASPLADHQETQDVTSPITDSPRSPARPSPQAACRGVPVAVRSATGRRRVIRESVPFRAREITPSAPEVAGICPALPPRRSSFPLTAATGPPDTPPRPTRRRAASPGIPRSGRRAHLRRLAARRRRTVARPRKANSYHLEGALEEDLELGR